MTMVVAMIVIMTTTLLMIIHDENGVADDNHDNDDADNDDDNAGNDSYGQSTVTMISHAVIYTIRLWFVTQCPTIMLISQKQRLKSNDFQILQRDILQYMYIYIYILQ